MNLNGYVKTFAHWLNRLTLFELVFLLGTFTSMANGLRVPGFGLGISEFLYLVSFLLLIVDRIYARVPFQKWLPWHPFWVTSLLILIGGVLSSLGSQDPVGGLVVTFKVLFVFSIWISMAIIMVTERHQEIALVVATCGLPVLSAAISVFDSRTLLMWGPQVAAAIGSPDLLVVMVDTGRYYGRFSGIATHPNIQSEYLVTASPMLLVAGLFAFRSKQWLRALALTLGFGIIAWAITLAGSFTGLLCLALIFTLTFGAGVLRNLPRLVIPGLAGVAALVLIGLLLISMDVIPLSSLFGKATENANVVRALEITGPDRFELMEAAARSIVANPLAGYGVDLMPGVDIQDFTFEGQALHNAPLRGWLYGGFIFFMGVAYAYWVGFGQALRGLFRYLGGLDDPLIVGLAISTFAWMVNDMTQPVFYQRFTWLTVALLFGLRLRWLRQTFSPNVPAEAEPTLANPQTPLVVR